MSFSRPVFAFALFAAQGLTLAADDRAGMAFFEANIRPLLVERCYECHSSEKGQSKGGLTLDTRAGWMTGGDSGAAIVPGKPEESLLIKAVRYDDAALAKRAANCRRRRLRSWSSGWRWVRRTRVKAR